ncbi:MAG: SRPBCC family protein [Myxococcales bacterium]|nr:SRPBCC family protein [Myxococcales bacterium]
MNVARHTVEIDAPPDRVYALITDFPAYPGFVPNQSATTVLSHDGDAQWRVRFELSVARKLNYVLDLQGTPGERLEWRLVEGDMMKANEGRWILQPLPGGRTQATYELEVALKGFVPRSVSRLLIERTLPANMQAFKEEAERRG